MERAQSIVRGQLFRGAFSTLLLLLLLPLFSIGSALTLQEERYKRRAYVTVTIDLNQHQLTHFWQAADGTPFNSIQKLSNELENSGHTLLFAINSGIYTTDDTPLGLHIEDAQVLVPLNVVTSNVGAGNFSLLPNGVFYITEEHRAEIVTTEAYRALSDEVKHSILHATQSGPMLIVDGEYNRRLIPNSRSLRIRSGVCAKEEIITFVVTEDEVNFYDFATFFKERLQCDNALYLDGSLARIYFDGRFYGASALSRMRRLIGIWGVTTPLPSDERSYPTPP